MPKKDKDKAVRFAESTDVAPAASKRPQNGNLKKTKRSSSNKDEDDHGNNGDEKPRWKKRPRMDRPNEDELDDVDDWVAGDEEDEQPIEGLPSEKERLEAKRVRRQKREAGGAIEENDDSEDEQALESTHIDNTTSLATEGVTIEPFHMENEKRDGTGYFDGDTFVFRKRDADEEPDAWLESLGDDTKDTTEKPSSMDTPSEGGSTDGDDDNNTAAGKLGHLSKEELYAKLLPLVSDTETVMQALVRYGSLIKRKPLKHRKKHKDASEETSSEADTTQSESFQMAQSALNELTETANALLGLGDVDVYQKTRNDVFKLLPQQQAPAAAAAQANNLQPPNTSEPTDSTVSWEYKGTQDGAIHGPYTTPQMKSWAQLGYFKGAQVRSVRKQPKSTVDDMLSDLMDDDDDAEGKESKTEEEFVRGEWQVSDAVDFDSYL